MKKYLIITLVAVFTLLSIDAMAFRTRFNQYWTITSSSGVSLFYGDMSDSYQTVFHKFADMNQLGFASGLNFRYRALPYFGMNMNVQMGFLKGKRTQWSNGYPVFYQFEAKVEEFDLIGDIDMLDLVDLYVPWLSLYAKGGIGFAFHQSVSYDYYFDRNFFDEKKMTVTLPFGGGMRVYLSKRIGLQVETMWHYALSDQLDGYEATATNENDMYTFTSLGFIFKLTSKPRRASYSRNYITYKNRKTFYRHKRFLPGGSRYAW